MFTLFPLPYLIPFLSALIGWVTNYIAIKMLFHPHRKVNLIIFSLQGIFPKRQNLIAKRLANVTVNFLISGSDFKEQLLNNRELDEKLLLMIEQQISGGLRNRIKKDLPLLTMFMPAEFSQKIKEAILEEVKVMLPKLKECLHAELVDSTLLKTLVENRITNFSATELEKLLMGLLRKEFKFIEISGAVLGFLIGLLQLFLLYL